MEEKAILEGFQQLKDGHEYDDLYYSAVARSEADWLVGINATRLFTVLYHHRLIVGRVQTPRESLSWRVLHQGNYPIRRISGRRA